MYLFKQVVEQMIPEAQPVTSHCLFNLFIKGSTQDMGWEGLHVTILCAM